VSIDTQTRNRLGPEGDRLSPRREVGVLAILLSAVAHLCIGLTLAALWVPPELLSSVQRRAVVPTDVDVLVEPGSDEAIADAPEKDEDAPQGPRGSKENDEPKQAPVAAKAPAVTAAPPAPKPAPAESFAVDPAAPSAPRPAAKSPAVGGEPSAAALGSSAPPGDPDAGGGMKRPELPSIMARFTHDLAEWASGVPAWQTAPVGDAGFIIVTLAMGDDGKVDKQHDPFAGRADTLPAALVESVKRTKGALVTKMGSRNVLVKFKVGAVVSDVPAPEGDTLKLSFDSYETKTKKGGSTFVLGTGRRVTFSVEVLETTALTAPP
jgi:hypothetical protein